MSEVKENVQPEQAADLAALTAAANGGEVEATATAAVPPSSWVSSSRVFTRLPLCPSATPVPAVVLRNTGWAFSQVVEPVVE